MADTCYCPLVDVHHNAATVLVYLLLTARFQDVCHGYNMVGPK